MTKLKRGGVDHRASRRGAVLQKLISCFVEQGYERVAPKNFFDCARGNQAIFARQCSNVGKDIYGKDRRVDFILYHPERWPNGLVIQCRSQNSEGGTDRKYPFQVASIQSGNHETMIVYSSDGRRKGTEEWLRAQAGIGKLVGVMNPEEFVDFIREGKQ